MSTKVMWVCGSLVAMALFVAAMQVTAPSVMASAPYWSEADAQDWLEPDGEGLSIEVGYPRPCLSLTTKRVPRAAVAGALEDPSEVPGWNKPAVSSRPVSWVNPRKRWLTLKVSSKPFHYLYNPLVFKTYCAR